MTVQITLRVTVTTMNGEVLEELLVVKEEENAFGLSRKIANLIEMKFETIEPE
jgi:hypothetical protein